VELLSREPERGQMMLLL